MRAIVAGLLLLGVFPATQSRASTVTFDSGLEGWYLVDANGSGALGDLSWIADGGNPGGFAQFIDGGGDGGFLAAPVEMLGDWVVYDGTATITYDHKIIVVGDPNQFVPYEVRMAGPGGEARWQGATPEGATGWVPVAVPLTEADWTVVAGTWYELLTNVTSFRIRIEQVDGGPDHNGLDNLFLPESATAVDPASDATTRRPLLTSAPNPFNPVTTITFEMPALATAHLQVFDLQGRLIATLVDGKMREGVHEIVWSGRDIDGREVPSGVYLSRLEAGGRVTRGRMMLIR